MTAQDTASAHTYVDVLFVHVFDSFLRPEAIRFDLSKEFLPLVHGRTTTVRTGPLRMLQADPFAVTIPLRQVR